MKRLAQTLTTAALLVACGDATRITAPQGVRGDEVVTPNGGGYGSGGVVAQGGGYGSGGNLIPASVGVLGNGGGFGSGGFTPADSSHTASTTTESGSGWAGSGNFHEGGFGLGSGG